MKKMLILISVAAVVLSVGTAVYAAEKTSDWGLYNGVTVFIGNPEPTRIEAPEMALSNGVTVFLPVISASSEEAYEAAGSAAGGMEIKESHPLYNGVTVFDPDIRDM